MNIIYSHSEITNLHAYNTVVISGKLHDIEHNTYTYAKFKIEVSAERLYINITSTTIAHIVVSVMKPTHEWATVATNENMNSVLIDFSGDDAIRTPIIQNQFDYAYDMTIEFLKKVYNFE